MYWLRFNVYLFGVKALTVTRIVTMRVFCIILVTFLIIEG
nr:hypothetical protein B11C_110084 [Bartonella sp. 1-1C]